MDITLQIKFKTTLEDYIDLNLHLYKHDPWIKFVNNIVFYIYLMVLLVIAIVAIVLDMTIIQKIIVLFVLLIVVVIWITAYHKSQKRKLIKKIKRLVKKDPSLLSERTLILDADRISIKSEKVNTDYPFDTFAKILDDEKCIRILNKRRRPIITQSNNIFPNAEVRESFLNHIKTYCQ